MIYQTVSPLSITLRRFRTAKRWSQTKLAELSGVKQSTISRLESGEKRTVDLDELEALATALGIQDPRLLLKLDGEEED